MGSPHARFSA
jgi:hypothetical protein